MKLRDMMFLVIGGLLVISGMVLNALLSGDANAQGDGEITRFGLVLCRGLYIADGSKVRGSFGLSDSGEAILKIYGDDGKTSVAYLGGNANANGEMMFQLQSKSKTDKRKASMGIDRDGGYTSFDNKMGEAVVSIGVISDGGGVVDTRDKFGYRR